MWGGWSTPRLGRYTRGKRHSTNCTGNWVGPAAGLGGCRKVCPQRDSNPGTSRTYPVAIPATLCRPTMRKDGYHKYQLTFVNKLSDHNESTAVGTRVFAEHFPTLALQSYGIFTNESRVYSERSRNLT